MPGRKHHWSIVGALLSASLTPTAVFALQPVETFLQGARRANHDNREAAATASQRSAEADVAKGRLYPVFSAQGSYTRNQYEVSLILPAEFGGSGERVVIQPQNQFDGNLALNVPLVDVAAWRRVSAADATAAATRATEKATQLDVEGSVYRSYYQLVGQEAVLEAAKRSFEVLQKNLEQVQVKVDGGTASELDIQRARAEIARAQGDIASADLAVVTARRQLETASSVSPEPASAFIDDDLHDEQPLDTWLSGANATPRVVSADAAQRAATKNEAAAEAAWYPTLSASAQERVTNATSFTGHAAVYLVQATLAWKFDGTLSPTVRAQDAAAAVNAVRAERAQRVAQDNIYQAWHQVRAAIEKSRAARVQITASQLAAELARDRYSVGAATQLDVLQAQQDAFRAEVSRIQADTDLAYARAALRTSAGRFAERDKP